MAKQFMARGAGKAFVLSQVDLSRSTYHYRPRDGKRGRKPPGHTLKINAASVPDAELKREIGELLSRDFVRYGYTKVTHHLKGRGYLINRKKVYRLMREEGLLLPRRGRSSAKRTLVGGARVNPDRPLRLLEMDIKYLYVHGEATNAYLLTVLDTFSRRALGYRLGKKMRKREVRGLLEEVLEALPALEGMVVRCDNGSQFIAGMVREYLKERGIRQEFTHVGTPEENAHIEAFHSILEAEVERAYEFDTFAELEEAIARYFRFYNSERIHSSLGYMSPDAFLSKHLGDELSSELEGVLQDSDLFVKMLSNQ